MRIEAEIILTISLFPTIAAIIVGWLPLPLLRLLPSHYLNSVVVVVVVVAGFLCVCTGVPLFGSLHISDRLHALSLAEI